jgi:hypothetical protein
VSLAASTLSPTLCSPRSQKRPNESPRSARAHALLAPRATREERVDKAAAVRVACADRPGGDLVPGADDAPERRVKALAPEVALRPRLEVARRVVPVIRERLLVRGVDRERVTLRVERDDAQPGRPLGCGRRRLELDAQLAEDAHGAIGLVLAFDDYEWFFLTDDGEVDLANWIVGEPVRAPAWAGVRPRGVRLDVHPSHGVAARAGPVVGRR